MITVLVQVAVATALLSVVLALVSQWWHREDSSGWHVVWIIVSAGSLCAAPLALVAPLPALGIGTVVLSFPVIANGVIGPALAATYVVGLIILLARIAVGHIAVRRLATRSVGVQNPDRERLFAVIGADADRCHVQSDLAVPVVAAGRILLPAAWTGWSATRLQVVLLHERAHLERRDAWWTILVAVHQAVYWPSPAAWWIPRIVRRHAERACDAAAARTVGATACARTLVESARDLTSVASAVPRLALGAHDDLSARIEALLTAPGASSRLSSAALVGVVVVVLTALTVAAQPGRAPMPASASADSDGHGARHAARHAAR